MFELAYAKNCPLFIVEGAFGISQKQQDGSAPIFFRVQDKALVHKNIH